MMKKEKLIEWFKDNVSNIKGGYIAAYNNEYEMKTYTDSQYMDLEFDYVGNSEEHVRFMAPNGDVASFTLRFEDMVNSTNVQGYDGCKCNCTYIIAIKLKNKKIFIMYFDLKEEN